MEACINYAQLEESKVMQAYYDWYNSDAPDAVLKRQQDEEERKRCADLEAKEEAEFQKFVEDNPDVVKKCHDLALNSFYELDKVVNKLLRMSYEKEKFTRYMKQKYSFSTQGENV